MTNLQHRPLLLPRGRVHIWISCSSLPLSNLAKPHATSSYQVRSLSATLSRELRDSRLSPTYDSRSRNISGEGHYRDTVEKSLQTSHNLMSVVTGSITPSQPKTRPASQASKPSSKKNQPTKEVWQKGSYV